MVFITSNEKDNTKLKRIKALRFSNSRFLLSKSEIRHTNSKVIFTLFIFNNKTRAIFKHLKNLYDNSLINFLPNNLKLRILKIKKHRKLKNLRLKKLNVLKWGEKKNINKHLLSKFNLSTSDKNSTKLETLTLKKKRIHTIKKALKKVKKLKLLKIFFFDTLKTLVKLYILNENKISLLVKRINKVLYLNNKKINLLKKYINKYEGGGQLSNNWINVKIYKLKMHNKKLVQKRMSLVIKLKKRYCYMSIKNLKTKVSKLITYLYFNQLIMFNKFKFTYLFLNYKGFGLINILSKIYGKKVEFNIVNLKSVHLNSDMLTESMAVKLSNRKNNLLVILKKALNITKLPKWFLYLNDKVSDISKKNNILNSIKYKNISGVRFEASGRLTRRLIAARSVFKLRYKGTVKNIYSSYKGIPSVLLRGYVKSSIQYTLINSKTRNGAFGLKGWVNSY